MVESEPIEDTEILDPGLYSKMTTPKWLERGYRLTQPTPEHYLFDSECEESDNGSEHSDHVSSHDKNAMEHDQEALQETDTIQHGHAHRTLPQGQRARALDDDEAVFNGLVLEAAAVGRNNMPFDTRLRVFQDIRSKLIVQDANDLAEIRRKEAMLVRLQSEMEVSKGRLRRTQRRLDTVRQAEAHVLATKCEIFSLPPELRRMVFELVLAVNTDMDLQDPSRLEFLLTCQMFHDEAKHMAYQSHHFRVYWTTGKTAGSVGTQLRAKITQLRPERRGDVRTLAIPLNKYAFRPSGQSRTELDEHYLKAVFSWLEGVGTLCLPNVQLVKFYHQTRGDSERVLQITMTRTDEIVQHGPANKRHRIWQVAFHPGHMARLRVLAYLANNRYLSRLP